MGTATSLFRWVEVYSQFIRSERETFAGARPMPEHSHSRMKLASHQRMNGAMAVEFSLLLFSIIMLFAFCAEWLRFSLIDQTLARVTHLSARAVVALPTASGCEAAVTNTFTNDPTASWLLDSDNDGVLDVAVTTADGWPAATGEVNLAISWEDNPNDATEAQIAWDDAAAGSCGGTGSWLRLRASAAALPWYGPFRALMPNGLTLTHESWGRNNRA